MPKLQNKIFNLLWGTDVKLLYIKKYKLHEPFNESFYLGR